MYRRFLVAAVAVCAAACSNSASPPQNAAPAASASQPSAGSAASTPAMMSSHAGEPMSIADVWAKRKDLAGQTVTVKGKVVKYNGGIMGRNWIHIQDGTGDAAAKTNDLTVTTTDEAGLGDTVTATGVVGIDKDFTAGYVYPVIIENARLAGKS